MIANYKYCRSFTCWLFSSSTGFSDQVQLYIFPSFLYKQFCHMNNMSIGSYRFRSKYNFLFQKYDPAIIVVIYSIYDVKSVSNYCTCLSISLL